MALRERAPSSRPPVIQFGDLVPMAQAAPVPHAALRIWSVNHLMSKAKLQPCRTVA